MKAEELAIKRLEDFWELRQVRVFVVREDRRPIVPRDSGSCVERGVDLLVGTRLVWLQIFHCASSLPSLL
jgi:hypothetical protein